MSSSRIEISDDATGTGTLFLRGEWSDQMGRVVQEGAWEMMAIHGVEWPDYQCLLPHASRIKRLRVPFGPDSSRGLDDLVELVELRSTDVLQPAVDFRKLTNLRVLEAVWDSKRAEFFANHRVEHMILHSIGGKDLSWIPKSACLKKLELRGGRLLSLEGLENAVDLEEFSASELGRLTDASAVMQLTKLRVLELDTPKASFADLSWILGMPDLVKVLISAESARIDWTALGKHPSLRSIDVTASAESSESDAQISSALTSGGRTLVAFKRLKGKVPAFSITLA